MILVVNHLYTAQLMGTILKFWHVFGLLLSSSLFELRSARGVTNDFRLSEKPKLGAVIFSGVMSNRPDYENRGIF